MQVEHDVRVDRQLHDLDAQRLRAHVMDLEREDRQPVDHRAGGFGVVPCVGRDRNAGDAREQRFVDAFDRVVALLVVAIDRPLVGGDRRVVDVGPARLILLVPEQAVVPMIGGDEARDVACKGAGVVARVTDRDGTIVERA